MCCALACLALAKSTGLCWWPPIRHDMENVVSWAEKYLAEFFEANIVAVHQGVRLRPQDVKWKPPDIGFVKLNTDAAISVQEHNVGLCMVIRDILGSVLASSTQRVDTVFSPAVAEALAILRGMVFAKESGLEPVVIEFDALEVVNLINSKSQVAVEIGLIIDDIREQLTIMIGAVVVFAGRNMNVVTHSLFKIALTIVEDHLWMESYSPCVERFVREDCPSMEEAKKNLYAFSTTTYTGFQCTVSEETSEKFKGLPGVLWVLPDSYIDVKNKDYGGDKYINGEIIPCTYPTYQPNKRKESKYVSKRYERRRDGPLEQRRPRQATAQSESASG